LKVISLWDCLSLDWFLQNERRLHDKPLSLNQRRIFILPTQRGFGFVVLIVLLMLIAFVYNNNLAYMLAFLLASIFFITILHTYKSLAGLVIRQGQTTPTFAGQAAGFEIHIDNPTRIERHHIQLQLQDITSFDLKPHNHTSLTLYETTRQRGYHSASRLTVFSTYPLGLFRAWSPIRLNAKALVYPKPWVHAITLPKTGAANNPQGQFSKGGDEFYGIQTYQIGDSIRQVHWKAYAKGLGVYSKQYGAETATEIWLDYHAAHGQSVEERLSYLCRLVVDAEQAGLPYGFILPGLRLPPATGTAHYRRCLEALAVFGL
jgi:uncharacterized protein (DUF58 family)